jgi:glycerol uptake facilitator-like aquaporin
MNASLPIRLLCEAIGTFFLMVVILASGGNFAMVAAAFAFIIYLTNPIGGAFSNPAAALGLWMSGSLNATMLTLFITAQYLGAAAGVWAYNVLA